MIWCNLLVTSDEVWNIRATTIIIILKFQRQIIFFGRGDEAEREFSSRSQYLGVPFLRYSAAFIGWRKCESLAVDRKTRNLFMIYRGLHPKSNLDRLYIPRNDRGRDLIAIEGCVELAVKGLEVYVHGTEEWLLQAAR